MFALPCSSLKKTTDRLKTETPARTKAAARLKKAQAPLPWRAMIEVKKATARSKKAPVPRKRVTVTAPLKRLMVPPEQTPALVQQAQPQ